MYSFNFFLPVVFKTLLIFSSISLLKHQHPNQKKWLAGTKFKIIYVGREIQLPYEGRKHMNQNRNVQNVFVTIQFYCKYFQALSIRDIIKGVIMRNSYRNVRQKKLYL